MQKLVMCFAVIALVAGCSATAQDPVKRKSMGGGGGKSTYQNEWAGSDLVDNDGNVNVGANETVTDHPSTDPGDFGFDGDGPPSIDS